MLWKKLVEKALRDEAEMNDNTTIRLNADNVAQRRAYPRRENDKCVSVIDDHFMPIENWSMSGVLLNGDDRLYNVGDNIDMLLKYKTSKGIVEVQQNAHVVRKGNERIALEFSPLNRQAFQDFQRVIDDDAASQFAASQA
ncbi:MAG: pilus assembly protein PilZ [Alphaproteobacteria bacterium]|nr:pilus assembly protein PilZ [Alphaproteobacteria bacterium]|tara:strand:- start:3837 stop:4256 length:420 start_codon:yes stop_codon:yes gene_type:complete